jgi:hypothetical protein
MQEKYWNYMVQVKSSVYYLDIYAEQSYKWDRRINVYSAIASSSSIAAWAIWKEWSYVWAIIIAISQVMTAIKVYFPFSARLKLLRPFLEEMKVLYIRMEYDWYKVAEGELTENEINSLLFSYKKEYFDIEGKYLKEEVLLENSKYMSEADHKTNQYFQNNF